MPARHDEDGGRERQLAVREGQRLDVSGQVMHRDDRKSARPGERLGERDADEQRADEAGPLRHRDGADVVQARSRRPRAPPRRRRRCRARAGATRAPGRRRPTRDGWPSATPRRWSGAPTGARDRRFRRSRRRPSRRRTSRCRAGARCSVSRPGGVTRRSAKRLLQRLAHTARVKMPRSVMMPAM